MKQISLYILFLLLPITSFSQKETVTIAECEIDTTANEYDKLLKYFIVEREEVKRLWKANVVEWAQFHPTISLEQKLGYWSSFEIDILVEPAYKKYEDNDYRSVSIDENLLLSDIEAKYTDIQLSLDYRFYITKKRRERLGKSTNGFSGSFLLLGGGISFDNKKSNNPVINSTIRVYSDHLQQTTTYDFGYNFKGGLGYQKRIGTFGYIEVKCGIMFNYFQDYHIKQTWTSTPVHYYQKTDFYYYDPYLEPLPNYSLEKLPFIDINMGFALKSLKRPLFK